MSWLKDEWKEGLPSNALLKITELENECERLSKDKKRLQFQLDAVQSSLDKSRRSEESLSKDKLGLERELLTVNAALEETRKSLESTRAALKEKNIVESQLTNDVIKEQKEKEAESQRRLQLARDNQRLLFELVYKEEELEKNSKELDKICQSTSKSEGAIKDKLCKEEYEHKKLVEENNCLQEGTLEKEERCEKALQGIDNTYTKALRRRIAKKEEEVCSLNNRIAKLESALKINSDSSNINEINCEKTSESSMEKLSNVENASTKASTDLVRNMSIMKFHIYDLERENEGLKAALQDQEAKSLSAECTSTATTESLRQTVSDLDERLAEIGNARDDMERQLHDEREMFMASEEKMKKEIESLKDEIKQNTDRWQDEREAFVDEERKMKQRIKELEKGDKEIYKEANMSVVQTLEAENLSLNKKICSLSANVDSLQREKSHLENENARLSSEKMKEEEDSTRLHLEEQIAHLQSHVRTKEEEMGTIKKEGEELRSQIEELYNELDEVNKILADEREKRKKLEVESLEFKKKERVYENAIAASMEGNEKKMISSFVKKRGERWNNDVIELRKKVEELEKKNRELNNAMDKRDFSVGAIKESFESKLREEQCKKASGTPERSSSSKEMVLKSSNYCTTISRSSSRHTNESNTNVTGDFGQTVNLKDDIVSQLTEQLKVAEIEKEQAIRRSNAKIKAIEEEMVLLKQHIQGMPRAGKVGCAPNTIITPKAFMGIEQAAFSQSELCRSSSKREPSTQFPKKNWNTLEELRDLVTEYTCESSELQEIVDESKEAMHELKKALQGNEGLFLVDSANMEELKRVASLSNGEIDDFIHIDEKESNTQVNDHKDRLIAKPSYTLSRLSLTDIDVEAVLSKLRIAISQLESRLEKVISDKERVETTIQTLEKDSSSSISSISKSYEDIANMKCVKENDMNGNRSAVIDIARERDAIITDGTIDDIAHEENRRPKDEKAFQHGQRCKLLWQQLCDTMASLSKYEREVAKHAKQKGICEQQIDEKEQRGSIEDICTQTENRFCNELEEKENKIKYLESQLIEEKRSFQLLQQEMENYRVDLNQSKEKNYKLTEKLEETRILISKYHRNNDKKLDVILNVLQEGLIGQVKSIIENDYMRKSSPSEFKLLSQSNSRQSSRNASFYSPEDGNNAEVSAKKSHQRRRRKDSLPCRTGSREYQALDEIELVKGKMMWIQDQVRCLLGVIEEARREKHRAQEECQQLIQRMEEKDMEMKKAEASLELERHRMNDNDTEYRAELDALKTEQLEVFQEFREICETVKRKDVELLNKSKHIKLLTAEWKEKEMTLATQIENLEKENKTLWTENSELRIEVERSRNVTDEFTRKMKNSEDNLNQLYQKLSQVDNIFYECKQKGLYK